MSVTLNFKNILNQGVNYNRYYIQSLIKYNKPIVVTGKFVGQANSAETKYTFTNIKPYVSEEEFDIYELTNHINIDKIDMEGYYSEEELSKYFFKYFVIVCEPYYYNDDQGFKRASLRPTDELVRYGFPAFKLLEDSKSSKDIPWNKVIDFRTEFDYKFVCPKNSKHCRYNEDGTPIKNFTYIEFIDSNLKNTSSKVSLDDMIKQSIGYSIFDTPDYEVTKMKKFHKKANIKSALKSSANRRMYDFKHGHSDSVKNNYSVFSQ